VKLFKDFVGHETCQLDENNTILCFIVKKQVLFSFDLRAPKNTQAMVGRRNN
jgi:hypothetical protein